MIKTLQETGLDKEDQGHPNNYVGFKIKKNHNRSYKFSQFLIDSILDDVDPNNSRKLKPVPMSHTANAHVESKPFHECDRFQFNHCSINVKLNCIALHQGQILFFQLTNMLHFQLIQRKIMVMS